MINDLNAIGFEPLLKNLLYGNEMYSEKTSKIAFCAVSEFIKETTRFQLSMNICHHVGFINKKTIKLEWRCSFLTATNIILYCGIFLQCAKFTKHNLQEGCDISSLYCQVLNKICIHQQGEGLISAGEKVRGPNVDWGDRRGPNIGWGEGQCQSEEGKKAKCQPGRKGEAKCPPERMPTTWGMEEEGVWLEQQLPISLLWFVPILFYIHYMVMCMKLTPHLGSLLRS